jgi:hypothetical protein
VLVQVVDESPRKRTRGPRKVALRVCLSLITFALAIAALTVNSPRPTHAATSPSERTAIAVPALTVQATIPV